MSWHSFSVHCCTWESHPTSSAIQDDIGSHIAHWGVKKLNNTIFVEMSSIIRKLPRTTMAFPGGYGFRMAEECTTGNWGFGSSVDLWPQAENDGVCKGFDLSNLSNLSIYHRRKFRSQTSDNMDRWKAGQGRGREKRKIRREKIRRERVRRQKIQLREKVGKSRNTVFFPMICGSGGSKSRLAKAAGAEPAGHRSDEKLHAVVARSTFASQNVQNTRGSDHFWKLWCRKSARRCGAKHISKSKCTKHLAPDHFWKLRCRKSARRCGAKHISKSKCTKHLRSGPLLEVEMSKKCTPLWREADFQVKSVKNWRSRTTFGGSDVEKVSKKCTPLWREAHFEVKSVKNWGFWAFFDVKMSNK